MKAFFISALYLLSIPCISSASGANVLIIKSSINGNKSFSNMIIDDFITKAKNNNKIKITLRDLNKSKPPYLTQEQFTASRTEDGKLSTMQKKLASYSNNAIAEIKVNDIIIVGAPMYNFSIPATLKAWIDQIIVYGKTFDKNGGFIRDKKLIIISTRGGSFDENRSLTDDFQEKYLVKIFNFIGINDIKIIRIQGIAGGENSTNPQTESAKKEISDILHDIN